MRRSNNKDEHKAVAGPLLWLQKLCGLYWMKEFLPWNSFQSKMIALSVLTCECTHHFRLISKAKQHKHMVPQTRIYLSELFKVYRVWRLWTERDSISHSPPVTAGRTARFCHPSVPCLSVRKGTTLPEKQFLVLCPINHHHLQPPRLWDIS